MKLIKYYRRIRQLRNRQNELQDRVRRLFDNKMRLITTIENLENKLQKKLMILKLLKDEEE